MDLNRDKSPCSYLMSSPSIQICMTSLCSFCASSSIAFAKKSASRFSPLRICEMENPSRAHRLSNTAARNLLNVGSLHRQAPSICFTANRLSLYICIVFVPLARQAPMAVLIASYSAILFVTNSAQSSDELAHSSNGNTLDAAASSTRFLPCERTTIPIAPGPGLPLLAPSVHTSTLIHAVATAIATQRVRLPGESVSNHVFHIIHACC